MTTPIFKAVLRNDVSAFLDLVQTNPSVLEERNHGESFRGTVLHLAVEAEHGELVSRIIEFRPSLVRSTNCDGDTPLHLAARFGQASFVTQMLESGQDLCMALNGQGETALNLACANKHLDIAGLILEKTRSITIVEFYATIKEDTTDLSRRMLEKFPNIAWHVDGEFSTPLHFACDVGNLDIVKMLLGLDEILAERVNKDGITPLHLAAMKCSVAILKEFLDKTPRSFNTLTPAKETVFHLAAKHQNISAFVFMAQNSELTEFLHRTDKQGNTVLHTAASVACLSERLGSSFWGSWRWIRRFVH
ncbi:PREDICTED: ankyrin-3-like isoform X2 [Camelina sativa]|uniref:Ankyrin-3-like isoform X2 n=1 Tax=Camelina sativa TaxID=90675 RepID=A0ABM0UZG5_CAMSA|nr:PREDICTED: ankyrin-3-like isoform X2 [Camelina sativa]